MRYQSCKTLRTLVSYAQLQHESDASTGRHHHMVHGKFFYLCSCSSAPRGLSQSVFPIS